MLTGAGYGFIAVIIVVVVGVYIAIITRVGKYSLIRKYAGIVSGRKAKSSAEPTSYVLARVIEKRQSYSREAEVSFYPGTRYYPGSKTHGHFYVTFKLNENRMMETEVQDTEYGILKENGEVTLLFNGSDYLGFRMKDA